jgi:hypothetical protein
MKGVPDQIAHKYLIGIQNPEMSSKTDYIAQKESSPYKLIRTNRVSKVDTSVQNVIDTYICARTVVNSFKTAYNKISQI